MERDNREWGRKPLSAEEAQKPQSEGPSISQKINLWMKMLHRAVQVQEMEGNNTEIETKQAIAN